MRAPAAGRNWEGYERSIFSILTMPTHGLLKCRFGGDPYLSGEGAYQTITGVQSTGVQAVAKHYINKSVEFMFIPWLKSENLRHFYPSEQEHYRTSSSSNVDDRTVRAKIILICS
jgi:beta-glucosidase